MEHIFSDVQRFTQIAFLKTILSLTVQTCPISILVIQHQPIRHVQNCYVNPNLDYLRSIVNKYAQLTLCLPHREDLSSYLILGSPLNELCRSHFIPRKLGGHRELMKL